MKQILLTGTSRYAGQALICWAPDNVMVGTSVKWNGSPWRVGREYSTALPIGHCACVRERPSKDSEDN